MDKLYIPRGDLNLDRSQLPQVKAKDIPEYLQWLRDHRGYTYARLELPVASLYPSQRNFNQTKIRTFMKQEREQLRAPILVSADNYVLDGHHRWIALLNMDNRDTVQAVVILAKIKDLIAATLAYPKSVKKGVLESFIQVTETVAKEKEKHSVLTFGRMNPPTAGHAKLVHKVHEVAQEHQADHHVVLSHSQDAEKNPLSQADKIKHAKRAFPGTHVTASSPKHPTIFHHASQLHKAGTKHLHVVVGSDRVKEFHDSLHKYNGHFDKEGHGYKFKSITVHSAGHRDPDAKGVEGMSASKMREHAKSGNFHEFKKGVASTVSHAHAKELYHDVRKGQTVNEDYMDQMPEKRGKFPVSHTQKPNPKCKDCDGTGYETKYHSWGTHSQSPCACTQLKESIDYLAEGVHDAAIFKAVFLAGAPGSGKDHVLKHALTGHGMTEINSDTALEHLMDKEKLDKKMPEHEQERRNVVRGRAKSVTELKQRLAIHGRNGLIINGTGAHVDQLKRIKEMLGGLGYDSKMVFVDTSDNVSRNRNVQRGQRGGRQIPEKLRAKKWQEAQEARTEFSKMFGGEHYHEFNNDHDLRQDADPVIAQQKTQELGDLHKTVRKFTQEAPKSFQAQQWVHQKMGKLAKMPPGNKAQQSKLTPPPTGSKAKEEADKLGLRWMGHGRYGKHTTPTHFTLNDRLVEKQKLLKPPVDPNEKKPTAAKKLDEAFEQFFTEDDYGISEQTVSRQYFTDAHASFQDARARSDFDLLTESEEEETLPVQKVDFQQFRILPLQDLQDLQESNMGSEPGPIVGGSPSETHDRDDGGVSTSVPKKTLASMMKKKS